MASGTYAERLYALARDHAGDLRKVVAGMIGHRGSTFNAVKSDEKHLVHVGVGLKKDDSLNSLPIPLRRDGETVASLMVHETCTLDPGKEQFLTVQSSTIRIQGSDGSRLIRFDFRRGGDGLNGEYPEAHVQVDAPSGPWSHFLGPKSRLGSIHIPVGGRRYRPCLEDVLEMLILERLISPAPGWERSLATTRAAYHDRQLRAAVRAAPHIAADELSSMDGWQVSHR